VADLIRRDGAAHITLALAQLSGALSGRIAVLGTRRPICSGDRSAHVDFAGTWAASVPPRDQRDRITQADVRRCSRRRVGRAVLRRQVRSWAGRRRKVVAVQRAARPGRAIVTALPAPRATASRALEIAGVRVTLSDTAGLRESVGRSESRHRATAGARGGARSPGVVDGSGGIAADDRAVAGRSRQARGAATQQVRPAGALPEARWSAARAWRRTKSFPFRPRARWVGVVARISR
jgi:hypothetical protein